MPRGFGLLIAAQFASALADNALLIVAIAVLQERGLPAWWAPVLKIGFTVSYVLLAPLYGPLADGMSKARLMSVMNGVKAMGVVGLIVGVHPAICLSLVGFGSAAYAPAKYGLITELVGVKRLVAANGMLEGSVVAAVLLGTVLGGALISPAWWAVLVEATASAPFPAPLMASLLAVFAVYAGSAVLHFMIPTGSPAKKPIAIRPRALVADFMRSNAILWRDRDGAISLAATTIFWGASASLQFVLLKWAEEALALPLYQSAYLQVVVAFGVIAGAMAAGRWIKVTQAKRMLSCGMALGLLLPLLAATSTLWVACPILFLAGTVGGLMLVPLNALLQHRGYVLLSAGRSVAVQGFNENAGVLVVLASYAALDAFGVPTRTTMWMLGGLISGSTAWLMWVDRARHLATNAVAPRRRAATCRR